MQATEALKNFTVAKIALPVQGNGIVELDCVIHMTIPPHFEATFLPNKLPVNQLDLEKNCKVFYFKDGAGHLLNSQVSKIVSGEKLLLSIKKNKVFNHIRDYFRVDAPGSVLFQRVSPEEADSRAYEGMINISGGGARFPVGESFSLHQKFQLNFFFRSPFDIEVECFGEVVRIRNFRPHQYIALKFIEIKPKAREQIISLCMAIQREDLRSKVRVSDVL